MYEKSPQPPPAKLFKSEEEQEKVIKLLEKRLEKHDSNRKAVQDKFTEILTKLTEQIGELEDRINKELCENFISEEDRLQAALNELRGNSTISAFQKAKVELCTIQSYEIIENKKADNDLTALYELKIERHTIPGDVSAGFAISEVDSSTHDPSTAIKKGETPCNPGNFAEERERLIELLEERLEKHVNNRNVVQDKIHEICERLRAQIGELEDRVNKELEEKFTFEDNRLQAALNEVRGNSTTSALQKAKAELLVEQSYEVFENKGEGDEEDDMEEDADEEDEDEDDDDDMEEDADEEDEDEDENDSVEPDFDLTTLYELKAERRIVPKLLEMRKPTNVRATGVKRGIVFVEFTSLNPDEERVLSDNAIVNPVNYKCMLFNKGNEQENKEYPLDKNEDNGSSSFFTFTPDILEAETTYGVRVKMLFEDRVSEWCDEIAEFTTPEFRKCCVWKECPDDVDKDRKYDVDEKNSRVATKVNSGGLCTIIGNTHTPLSKVTRWDIKILKSRDNDGNDIYIGIAQNDINQNRGYNCNNGWYLYCYYSVLWSGPPHSYSGKEYGPRKGDGQYVQAGDSVGVVVDTTKGDLSFVLNGINLGVAFEGIPLNKPLVPCALLYYQGDSVELII